MKGFFVIVQKYSLPLPNNYQLNNYELDSPFPTLRRLPQPGSRHRDGQPQRGRLVPLRRDGRPLCAQHLLRHPRGASHQEESPEAPRCPPDDRGAGEVLRGLRQGRRRHHHLPLRGLHPYPPRRPTDQSPRHTRRRGAQPTYPCQRAGGHPRRLGRGAPHVGQPGLRRTTIHRAHIRKNPQVAFDDRRTTSYRTHRSGRRRQHA